MRHLSASLHLTIITESRITFAFEWTRSIVTCCKVRTNIWEAFMSNAHWASLHEIPSLSYPFWQSHENQFYFHMYRGCLIWKNCSILHTWDCGTLKSTIEHLGRVTVTLMTSLCWWLNDDDHFKMLVTKKYVRDIFLHVGDILIGDQHHNMPECDVGDRYVMLQTWNSTWCQIFSSLNRSSEN